MSTMLILRGFPASGKSTYAKKWVAEDPAGRARVNRDMLRLMAHDGAHIHPDGTNTAGTEKAIIAARDSILKAWLRMGLDVIVDDTNLSSWHVMSLMDIADRMDARTEIIDLRNVPIEVCIERDAQRTGHERLGAEVIMSMYTRFGSESQSA